MSSLCRVDYLRADGTWVPGHAGIALIDPERYASACRALCRITVLDERLRPTDEVYLSPGAELL